MVGICKEFLQYEDLLRRIRIPEEASSPIPAAGHSLDIISSDILPLKPTYEVLSLYAEQTLAVIMMRCTTLSSTSMMSRQEERLSHGEYKSNIYCSRIAGLFVFLLFSPFYQKFTAVDKGKYP